MRGLEGAPARVFSIPAYFGAVASGTGTVGLLLGLDLATSTGTDKPVQSVFMTVVVAVVTGLLPGLLCFLPSTLLGLWVANRFGRRSRLAYLGLGALSAAATAAAFWLAVGLATPSGLELTYSDITILGIFALAGVVAAAFYHWLELAEMRKRGSP